MRGADGSNGAATAPVESAMPFTNAGARYTPPLATVFIMAVICSGVTVSAPLPEAEACQLSVICKGLRIGQCTRRAPQARGKLYRCAEAELFRR